jgi:hypothetical protein
MYSYIELKDREIISYGKTTSMDLALLKTTGTVMEITEKQLAFVSACHGDLNFGDAMLKGIVNKIERYYDDLE